MADTTVTAGIGIGGAIAIYLSMTMWNHIGWAMLHGFFGWFYVIYQVIQYR